MDEEMVLLFSSNKLYQVELVREVLMENGIESEIMNKIDSLFPVGEAEVFVSKADEDRARHLISEVR